MRDNDLPTRLQTKARIIPECEGTPHNQRAIADTDCINDNGHHKVLLIFFFKQQQGERRVAYLRQRFTMRPEIA